MSASPPQKNMQTSKCFQTAQTLPVSKKCPDPGKSNALGDLEFLSYLIHTQKSVVIASLPKLKRAFEVFQ
jgi:hypothetical protein